ncbi:MAG TPA: alpha-galactosidase [Spirochaetia bacterium]|nr:alpha-galactosidase [Spirochaetia bacterium]
MALKCAYIGAGSRTFGPSIIRDLFLSEPICSKGLELVLMDIVADHLGEIGRYCEFLNARLRRSVTVRLTTDLTEALRGADFVVCAIEVQRYLYWSQDFHVPRDTGIRHPFGENGGVGGIFHALRNMGPMVHIAREMERLCPKALMLSFTNPEHKLCEGVTRLTSIQAIGLCHGVFMGQEQIAEILGRPESELDTAACGINHFTWFQEIRDKKTGEDLYPLLKERERKTDWFTKWHEMALGRILLRRFGMWPSPGANHYGEYIRWADEYVVSNLQFHYDPEDGHPWTEDIEPRFVYYADNVDTSGPWGEPRKKDPGTPMEQQTLKASGEIAVKIIESLATGVSNHLEAINVPNRGYIPNLDEGTVVEVPAHADGGGIKPRMMRPFPEAIAALLRLQGSIHKLIVEAFAETSREKLIQAVLLDPSVDSYRHAIVAIERLLELQKNILPKFT